MKYIVATDAKNRFGHLLSEAQKEPVTIQKNGKNLAVLVSAEQFERLTATNAVSPRIGKSLERSLRKWDKVYEALAK